MNHSEACTKLVMIFEGLRLDAYLDSAGIATLGYGHIKGVKLGDECIKMQAEVWLDMDLLTADAAVNRLVTVPLEQEQFDALVSFTYNVGAGTLAKSTLLKRVNAYDTDGAAAEFSKYVHAGGKIVDGLVRRRAAEAALFLSAAGVRLAPNAEQIKQAAEDNNVG